MPKSRSLAEFAKHQRWTDTDARVVLDALDESGLSVAAFARREGFDAQRLYFWRRRLEASVDESPKPAFVEVRRGTVDPVEVVLRSGRVLRVSASIDGAVLRHLVDALEQDPAC